MPFFNQHNLKAAGIHLFISTVIAGLTVLLVYGVWYPAPLYQALGVGTIFLLIVGIDLILGPLMTLVVYKPQKSSLPFDLTVIACVQLAALLYGLNTVSAGRPAFMVFTHDRFDLILAYEVPSITGTHENPSLTMQNHWEQPVLGYQLQFARKPDASQARLLELLMQSALNGGPDIANVRAFHDDYTKALPTIKASAATFTSLDTTAPIIKARASDLQAKYPTNSLLLPLKIKYTIYTVVLNPTDARVLGIEPVDVF